MKGKRTIKKLGVFLLTFLMMFGSFNASAYAQENDSAQPEENSLSTQTYVTTRQISMTKYFSPHTSDHAAFTINGQVWNRNGNSNTYTKQINVNTEYLIHETAPDDYAAVGDFTIKFISLGYGQYDLVFVGTPPAGVTIDGNDIKVTNKLSQKKFDFIKEFEPLDEKSQASYPDFEIAYPDGTSNIYSSADGSYPEVLLKVGDNSFTETNTPAGYENIGNFVITLDEDGELSGTLPDGVSINKCHGTTIKVINSLIRKNINLVKIYEGKHFDSVSFTVNGEEIAQNEGIFDSVEFKYGTEYTFAETNTDDNYVASDSFTLKLDSFGNLVAVGDLPENVTINGNDVTVFNAYKLTVINLIKTDGKNEISGAAFNINGDPMRKSDGGNRFSADINNVTEYTISEKAPIGYIGVADFTVQINEDRTGLEAVDELPDGVSIDGFNIVVENTKMTNTITLLKTDGEEPLIGADFSVFIGDDEVEVDVDNGTTFTAFIEWGNIYTISENKVPKGYDGISDFQVKLSDDGQSLVLVDEEDVPGVSIEGMTITVSNTIRENTMTILKTDGKDPLKGSMFEVSDTEVIADEDGTTFGAHVQYGIIYTIHESEVPVGYTGVEDFQVALCYCGQHLIYVGDYDVNTMMIDERLPEGVTIDGMTITVVNTKLTNTMKIYKTDGTNLLSGALFEVSDLEVAVDKSGSEFSALIEHGVIYTVHESITPTGYTGVADFQVKLSDDGQFLVAVGTLPDDVILKGMTISVANDPITVITTRMDIPNTGDTMTLPIMMILFAASGLAGWYVINKKKNFEL